MTTFRPQPISDRIAAWKQAYDAVKAELEHSGPDIRSMIEPFQIAEIAARTAATLAIGATTRERGE